MASPWLGIAPGEALHPARSQDHSHNSPATSLAAQRSRASLGCPICKHSFVVSPKALSQQALTKL